MNDTTNKAVDVLAVIRSRANRRDNNGLPVTDETLLEAADAVAELIDATRAEYAAEDAYQNGTSNTRELFAALQEARARRYAALVRVGGVA